MYAQDKGVSRRSSGSKSTHQKTDQRRLKIFQSRGLFSNGLEDVGFLRAISSSELAEAYRLVYEIFLNVGFILPCHSSMRIRPYETSRDTATFVANLKNRTIGVIGLITDSKKLKLPSDGVFGRELDLLRGNGKLLCEVTNQVVSEEFRKSAVTTELMRCAWAQAWITGCTDMICSISPRQQKFYEFIGFELIGTERSYSSKIYDPVINMRWNLEELRERWLAVDINDDTMDAFWKKFFLVENPYIFRIRPWAVLAEDMFENPYELASLFENCVELFTESTPSTLEAIRSNLGQAFYLAHQKATGSIYPRVKFRRSTVADSDFRHVPRGRARTSRPLRARRSSSTRISRTGRTYQPSINPWSTVVR